MLWIRNDTTNAFGLLKVTTHSLKYFFLRKKAKKGLKQHNERTIQHKGEGNNVVAFSHNNINVGRESRSSVWNNNLWRHRKTDCYANISSNVICSWGLHLYCI